MKRMIAMMFVLSCVGGCADNNKSPDTASNPQPTPQTLPPARGGDPAEQQPPTMNPAPMDTNTTPMTPPTGTMSPNGTSPMPSAPPATGAPQNNTQQDNNNTQQTADQDTKMTQQIRQALRADNSLSMQAKSVNITTNNGRVTLKGQVRTARERDAIVAAAKKIAGDDRVDNQIDVK